MLTDKRGLLLFALALFLPYLTLFSLEYLATVITYSHRTHQLVMIAVLLISLLAAPCLLLISKMSRVFKVPALLLLVPATTFHLSMLWWGIIWGKPHCEGWSAPYGHPSAYSHATIACE